MTKILTHVHLYYTAMWPEIKTRLKNIGADYDLFVTLTAENESLRRDILTFKPDADVAVVANRGFDVAPFIDILNRIDLDDYDYIIKLHTKRDMPKGALVNGFDLSGDAWRTLSLRFLETREAFTRVLRAFEADKTLGMIGDYRLICRKDGKGERSSAHDAMAIMERLGLPSGRYAYVMGTMFMACAQLFNRLKRLSLTGTDFAVGERGADPLPYAMERVFGYLVGAQGMQIKDPLTSVARQFASKVIATVKNFLYRKKTTADGKVIVKICKIPLPIKKKEGGV